MTSTGGAATRSAYTTDAHRLTDRETDVWWLLAQGWSNAEIAERLRVTEATVKTHVSRVLAKLGVRGLVETEQAWRFLVGPTGQESARIRHVIPVS